MSKAPRYRFALVIVEGEDDENESPIPIIDHVLVLLPQQELEIAGFVQEAYVAQHKGRLKSLKGMRELADEGSYLVQSSKKHVQESHKRLISILLAAKDRAAATEALNKSLASPLSPENTESEDQDATENR